MTTNDVLDDLIAASGIDDLRTDDELVDLGIDSVRLMRLTERWRAELPELNFAAVVGARTISELFVVLHAKSA